MFVAGDQDEILTEKNVQGAPALVIEVLSPGTRKTDENAKRRLFECGGVREYWLVDPDSGELTLYRRAADGAFQWTSRLAGARHDVLTTPLLPGFSLRVDDLFA
jgi:Uma2 family endonuclease